MTKFGFAGMMFFSTLLPCFAIAKPSEAEMEVQRCVWRCMHDNPGLHDSQKIFKKYNQCTIDKCSMEKPRRKRKRM